MATEHAARKLLKSVLNKEARINLRRTYYFGTSFRCSLCDSQVRTMFDIGEPFFPVLDEKDVVGGEKIAQDVCPVCYSSGRTRLLWEYLRREVLTGERPAPKVLHVAPENALLRKLRTSTDYVAVDIDPGTFDDDVRDSVAYCDITDIGFPDDTFDLIICCHVLEHIPRDDLAIRELHRVLKPGGLAILQVPIGMALRETIEDPTVTDPRERERRFGQLDHVRIYGPDYPRRLASGGFEVEVLDCSRKWGADVASQQRLNPRERLFLGRKPVAASPPAARLSG